MPQPSQNVARLLITCPDKPGIVAAITAFLANHGANVTALDQYSTDPEGGVFFMRLEFQTPHLDVGKAALENAFQHVVAEPFEMNWRISYAAEVKRVAILVSKQEHCHMELLWRWARGELPCEVAMIISNHPDHKEQVERFGVPYHYVPAVKGEKEKTEAEMLALMDGKVDTVVLARYMQILSGDFVSHYPNEIINIHHSFLPAFVGADPYRQAKERGVKLIGATAHYVTEELDAGPIIDQDVTRVSHKDSYEDLKNLGHEIERRVLAKAVRLHLDDRILIRKNKTVVF